MPHLLVTNDFPPKVGGIQTYLWELWRRLPPGEVTVLTTAHPKAEQFDRDQSFRVERINEKVMLPTPGLGRRIRQLADEVAAGIVVLDPALPLGLLGPRLGRPYALVMHGSELLGRLPGGSQLMGTVVRGARQVVAAGGYPASETRRVGGPGTPPITIVPPGIDLDRFRPFDDSEKRAARRAMGLPEDAQLVVGLSRLVTRKGFDRLIEASAQLAHEFPRLHVAIGGSGRDRDRLQRIIEKTAAPARLLGRVPDDGLPSLYACADVFAMLCRTQWGGLEPEGFGIVFLEAAACGVPQIAGDSGGAADAVVDGETGVVVREPGNVDAIAAALARLLGDDRERAAMGARARARVLAEFSYDHLAQVLGAALASVS